jgi:hypothetical protein
MQPTQEPLGRDGGACDVLKLSKYRPLAAGGGARTLEKEDQEGYWRIRGVGNLFLKLLDTYQVVLTFDLYCPYHLASK